MQIFEQYSAEINELETYISKEAVGKQSLRILEAGCGREWHLRPKGVRIELTGLDLDRSALEFRKNVMKDLDEAIVGDLRTAPLPSETFDIVYSSFVLEHIDGAERALDNMVQALKPEGLLIVRVPDLHGAQTFLARRLPHFAAIAYYRYAWNIKKAGQPGFAPYPTHYDRVISAPGFHDYCQRNGLTVIAQFGVGSYTKRGLGLLSWFTPIAARLVSIATLGKVHDRYVDLTFIVRKSGKHDTGQWPQTAR